MYKTGCLHPRKSKKSTCLGSNVAVCHVTIYTVTNTLCTSVIAYICIPAPGAKVPVSHAYACMGTTSRICDSLARHIVTDERLLISHSFRRRPKDGQLARKQKKENKPGGKIWGTNPLSHVIENTLAMTFWHAPRTHAPLNDEGTYLHYECDEMRAKINVF